MEGRPPASPCSGTELSCNLVSWRLVVRCCDVEASGTPSLTETVHPAVSQFMASHGNDAARDTYESKVPPFYYRPTFSDCQLLREQWIRAKYERQEFTHPDKQEPYSAGYREGFLWKRGRDNGQFLSRKFVLTEREGSLKYFNRNDAKEPKAVMKIEHLNATFQPAKIGHPHGLQVTYLKDNSTRNIFVYHEDGKVGAGLLGGGRELGCSTLHGHVEPAGPWGGADLESLKPSGPGLFFVGNF
nr:arf-GAP with dual PH domain-containing protein 1 isoform X2 [Mirounga angustirostris]